MVLGYDDRVQYGTVTASSEAATMEAVNVTNPDINLIWRAAAGGAAWVVVDLGASYLIGFVYAANTNVGAADLIRVRVSSADPTGAAGDLYDSGSIASGVNVAWGALVHVLPSDVTGRYVRLDLTPGAGAAEVGRLAAGKLWRPTHNFSYGTTRVFRGNSQTSRSRSQVVYVDERPTERGVQLRIDAVKEAEAVAQLQDIAFVNGDGRDVLVCLDPDSSDLGRDSFWGLIEDLPDLPLRSPKLYNTSLRVMSRV